MSCCDEGCTSVPVGWSRTKLRACVHAVQAVGTIFVRTPAGELTARPGDWVVRIPALDTTLVLSNKQFVRAFTIEASHAG